MAFQRIVVDQAGHVVTLTLDRSDKYNAMDLLFLREFAQCLQGLAEDSEARAIIITDSDHVILSGVQAETIAQRLVSDSHSKDGNLSKAEKE